MGTKPIIMMFASSVAFAASAAIAQPFEFPARLAAAPDRCADLAEMRDRGTLSLRKQPQALPAAEGGPVRAALRPRVKPRKPRELAFDPAVHTGRIVLKLADDEGFMVDVPGALTAIARERASRVSAAISGTVGPAGISRIFSRKEVDLAFDRFCGERWTEEEMPDLTQFLLLVPSESATIPSRELLVDALNKLEFVEISYFEGKSPPPSTLPPAPARKSGPLEIRQGYLGPAPYGVDARYAWGVAGGTGAHARIFDIEVGWNLSHEDSPGPFAIEGTPASAPIWTQHGTAVLGIIAGVPNDVGIVGLSFGSAIALSATDETDASIATAIDRAVGISVPGDILLLERQIHGPASLPPGASCADSQSNNRAMVLVEYDDAIWAAIRVATANRRVVIEAAGNGAVNLANPAFGGRFDPGSPYFMDSGAIVVGARHKDSHLPSCMTNYGLRLDASGWGSAVVSSGYGDLTPLEPADSNRNYTELFGGTSGGAAIVAGSAALVQSMQVASSGREFGPEQMRFILRNFGTDQEGWPAAWIGRMPDLRRIHEWLLLDNDKDGMSNGDELAAGRNPDVSEAGLITVLTGLLDEE